MRRQERALTAVLSTGILAAAACGGSGGTADNEGSRVVGGAGGASASGGSAGSGADAASGGAGGSTLGCQGPGDCGAGQKCAVSGVCIDQNGCATTADCAGGTFCSATKACLPEGSCAQDQDCTEGLVCDAATSTCVPGGGCGGGEFQTEAIAPNLLLVLDRSCSMNAAPGGLPKTKWAIAVDAINLLTTQFTGKIRWGLTLFPDTVAPACEQAAAAIPVGDGNEAAIQALLTAALANANANFPKGPCVTNIDTAIQQASLEPAFADPGRRSFAVLITDGNQAGCNVAGGDNGTTTIIGSMLASGVATYVVGFGSGVDPNQLNVFADAGGVPRADPTRRYYQADDAATLQMSLDSIASSVLGCDFALAEPPMNADELFVFLEDQSVPRDPTHTNGWDYDPVTNSVTFYGTPCDQLKSGMAQDVDVVFGCDQPVPN